MAILYFTDGVKMPNISKRAVSAWVKEVAAIHERSCGDISYIFCNDEKILEINNRFLSHNYYTDIITFDYGNGKRISGDLFISLDTVKSNTEELCLKYEEELNRVIIHGILHLCGINDKAPGERDIMEREENNALLLLKKQTEE